MAVFVGNSGSYSDGEDGRDLMCSSNLDCNSTGGDSLMACVRNLEKRKGSLGSENKTSKRLEQCHIEFDWPSKSGPGQPAHATLYQKSELIAYFLVRFYS